MKPYQGGAEGGDTTTTTTTDVKTRLKGLFPKSTSLVGGPSMFLLAMNANYQFQPPQPHPSNAPNKTHNHHVKPTPKKPSSHRPTDQDRFLKAIVHESDLKDSFNRKTLSLKKY